MDAVQADAVILMITTANNVQQLTRLQSAMIMMSVLQTFVPLINVHIPQLLIVAPLQANVMIMTEAQQILVQAIDVCIPQ